MARSKVHQAYLIFYQPVNPVHISMMFIITVLVLDIHQYIETTERADGQSKDVDKTEGFVFEQETPGGFEIGSEHVFELIVKLIVERMS